MGTHEGLGKRISTGLPPKRQTELEDYCERTGRKEADVLREATIQFLDNVNKK